MTLCLICLEKVYENAVKCPVCNHLYHFNHLVEYIKQNGRCPFCKTK
ncbi:MAG: RING finger domain-containing protein, partial [Candidatus Heimdallarchaeaceae archaeon]